MASSELITIQRWLSLLTRTYAEHPSSGLAKVITYYLTRLIKHDDFPSFSSECCHYVAMFKYWQWQSSYQA
jgi:hypothetical protein